MGFFADMLGVSGLVQLVETVVYLLLVMGMIRKEKV